MRRYKIIVSGVVQGVGFRYFSRENAIKLNINGYVKNLPNGNVEIIAEGEKGNISEFIKVLKIGPISSYVKSLDIEETDTSEKLKEFRIN